MRLKNLSDKIIYKDNYNKVRITIIHNMLAYKPYCYGLNCSKYVEKIGFVIIDNKLSCYMLNLNTNSYYIGSIWNSEQINFFKLIKYRKFDIHFRKISLYRFIYRYISYLIGKK